MSQKIWWLISLVIVVGLTLLHFLHPTPSHQTLISPHRCELSSARFIQPGRTKVYSVNYTHSSQSDWSRLLQQDTQKTSAAGLGQKAYFHLEADWEMSIIEIHGETYVLNQLKNTFVELTNNGVKDSHLNQQISSQLSKGFNLLLDRRGTTLKIEPQSPMTSLQKNLLRWLVSESEIVFPEKYEAQWLAKEQDPNGIYEASYHLEEKDVANGTIIKTKRSYLSLAGAQNKRPQHRDRLNLSMSIHPQVTTSIEIDCEKALVRHMLTSGHTQSKIGITEIGSAENNFELKLKSDFQNNLDLASISASLQNIPQENQFNLMASESREEMERLIHKTELGSLTAKNLLHLLDQAKSSENSREAIQALYLKFKALIFLHPEKCALLAETMKKENPRDSKAMQMIATALSSIGSPDAQQALISTLQARSEEVDVAQVLIPALGMTDHPTLASEQALKELIQNSAQEDIVTTAGLSLGAMAGHLAEDAPERQKQIVDAVLHDFEKADNEQQRRFLISMLGNAGSPDSFSVLSKSLDSREPREQAEAAMALRFIPGPEVDERLLKVFTQPVDNSVKIAAATALDFREASGSRCQNLRSIFNSQNSVGVKRELIRHMFECRFVDQGVIEWLIEIQKNDPSEDVRKLAEEYARILTQSNI